MRDLARTWGGLYRLGITHSGELTEVKAPYDSSSDSLTDPPLRTRMSPREATILIVDDDDAVLRVLARIVATFGSCVLTAGDAEEALAIAAAQPPDLVICDVALPGASGVELARRLSGRSAEPHVLFISGYGREAIGERYGFEDGVPLLAKPFSVRELADAISAVLEARALAA